MKLSKVLASAITFRLDSEYYRKQYLSDESLIHNNEDKFQKLHSLGLEVDGSAFYPALEPFYGSGSFPFIRVADVKGYVDFDNCERIPKEILPDFPTLKIVNPGDIVLTKGGSIGRAGLVTQEGAASRDLIFINSSKLEEAEYTYLSLYFQTDFCNRLLVRSSSMSVQPHLTLTLVKDIDIFKTTKNFQEELLKIILEGRRRLEHSKALYANAENLLLEEIGLKDWQASGETIAIKSLKESFGGTTRLDAEFYEPRFIELEAKLRGLKSRQLATLVSEDIKRGIQPIFVEGGDVHVIASKAVRPTGVILDDEECTNRQFYEEKKTSRAQLKRGDVLLNGTGRGTLGRASVYNFNRLAIADNHVTIIRTKEEVCDPYYLMLYLNSFVGQWQSEKYQCGSSGQLELYPDQIGQFLIYIPPQNENSSFNIQSRISSLVKKSFTLLEQSKGILNIAKRGVELAIEQAETSALAWMEAQTAAI